MEAGRDAHCENDIDGHEAGGLEHVDLVVIERPREVGEAHEVEDEVAHERRGLDARVRHNGNGGHDNRGDEHALWAAVIVNTGEGGGARAALPTHRAEDRGDTDLALVREKGCERGERVGRAIAEREEGDSRDVRSEVESLKGRRVGESAAQARERCEPRH